MSTSSDIEIHTGNESLVITFHLDGSITGDLDKFCSFFEKGFEKFARDDPLKRSKFITYWMLYRIIKVMGKKNNASVV